MTPDLQNEIRNFIQTGNHFIILGHTEPDGDCVGSQLTLRSFLRRTGKQAFCFSEGPFDRTEIKDYAGEFYSEIDEALIGNTDAAVIVDTSTRNRVGKNYRKIEHLPVLLIDHHVKGEEFGDLRLVETEMPSTTCIVLELMEIMGHSPTKEEADLLFFGLATDTGFFRHVESGAQAAFTFASRLVQYGADPKEMYSRIYGQRTFAHRQHLAELIRRTESFYNGKLLITYQKKEDAPKGEPLSRNSDELYNLLQTIKDVEAVVFIREETKSHCSVGLRSFRTIDVASIARSYGGGGHKLAAGFSAEGTIHAIKKALVSCFKTYM